jgi:charged multivesicular body protein 1
MPLFGKSNDEKLFEQIFQLNMTSKQLQREAKKAEKNEAKQKQMVTKYLRENKPDFAKQYAENSIRAKNESLNYLRLASRMDAVSARIKSAQTMKKVTIDMAGVNKSLTSAMKTMNLEQIQGIMDRFETQVEKLDLHSATMEQSMGQAMATSTPTNQVDALIKQVADENNLEYVSEAEKAPSAISGTIGVQQNVNISQPEADLDKRLAQLRN